jgi:hypothetical protein
MRGKEKDGDHKESDARHHRGHLPRRIGHENGDHEKDEAKDLGSRIHPVEEGMVRDVPTHGKIRHGDNSL